MIAAKAGLVVLLRDEFDGSVIRGGGQSFAVDGRPARPIAKPEGFYVFTGLAGDRFRLTVSGGRYLPRALRLEAYRPGGAPRTLRLLRRRGRFSDCGWVCGEGAPPGGQVCVFLKDGEPPILEAVKAGDGAPRLVLRGFPLQNLQGLRLAAGEGEDRELLLALERRPDGSYALEAPPRRPHAAGEPVLRAFLSEADGRGRYAVPVPPGAEGGRVWARRKEGMPWECL